MSDVKFLDPTRFLKKGFCSNYFLDVAFHVGVMDGNYQVITVISSWYGYFTSFIGGVREFSLPLFFVTRYIYIYPVINYIYIGERLGNIFLKLSWHIYIHIYTSI